MSRRITISVPEKTYIQIAAISRVEHRRPAEMARMLLLDAIEQGLRPSQKLLFDEERSVDGRPMLRLIRGGSE